MRLAHTWNCRHCNFSRKPHLHVHVHVYTYSVRKGQDGREGERERGRGREGKRVANREKGREGGREGEGGEKCSRQREVRERGRGSVRERDRIRA